MKAHFGYESFDWNNSWACSQYLLEVPSRSILLIRGPRIGLRINQCPAVSINFGWPAEANR